MNLKILTLNTWQKEGPWEDRWKALKLQLQALNPDIIGFQEMFDLTHAQEIAEELNFELIASEYPSGLVFLSKFQCIQNKTLVMRTQSPEESEARYAFLAEFQVDGQSIYGLNTHLSWRISENDIRELQVRELLEFADLNGASTSPAFMVGDFNSAPNTKSIQTVQEIWVDTYLEKNAEDDLGRTWVWTNPFAARAKDKMPERRIDYIFTQNMKNTVSSKVVCDQVGEEGVYPSDHFGVLSEVGVL